MTKTEILIVGAGPAGLGAAIEAARLGAKVLIVDENLRAGGQLYKQIHKFFGSSEHYAGTRGFQIADKLLGEANALGARIELDTRALGLLDDGNVPVLRGGHPDTVDADKIILAVGAKENALMFPGWTLPGVMTAGAAQTFSNVHGILVGKEIVVIGSGNVGLIVAYQLTQAGAEIKALVEAAPEITGYKVHANKLLRLGIPIYASSTVKEARGEEHVEEAIIAQVDEKFAPIPGTEKSVKADTILIAAGLNPRMELATMFQCAMTFEPALGGVMPIHDKYLRTSNPDVYVCGDQAGVEEASAALEEGRLAGLHAAVSLGYGDENSEARLRETKGRLDALRSGIYAKKRFMSKQRIMEKGEAYYGE